MKNKICNIILIILAVALIITVALIAIKYGSHQVKEAGLQDVVEEVKTQIKQVEDSKKENKQVEVEYKGYNVVGIIKIPAINIEYLIIDKTNDEAMKVSVTKFWGNDVNEIGNLTIAGHNYLDGTMFSDTKKLNIGDKIEMTDLSGKTMVYAVFNKYVIDPNDVSCVNSVQTNTREITLLTCTNGRSNRLVIKARELI